MRHATEPGQSPCGERRRLIRRAGGFTLVEMIVSIMIAAILAGMLALFGRGQINAYLEVGARAELADAADTALRRVGRDLQGALPNSVRQSGPFLEFVPIRDAGRYRADVDNAGSGDFLDFGSAADTSFAVLGPPVSISAGDQLVVFNLGQPGADVYEGSSRRAASAGTSLSTVSFAPAGAAFPFASPQSRFHIVGAPVTYECAADALNPEQGRLIRHSGYGFRAAVASAPWSLGGVSAVLVNNVADCAFNYTTALLRRGGLVVLRLTLQRNDETITLLHQVDVLNTP